MKKLLSILLVLTLCISLLPMVVLADPTKLGSVDITIELPNGGDAFDFGYIPIVTSFTGGGVDLLANGAGIMYAYWNGDYDLDEYMIPYFRNGGSYNVTLQLMFGPNYCTNGTVAFTGETVAMPETFSATVNGVAATVRRNTSTYYPTIEVNLTLAGEVFNAEQKSERNEEWEEIKKARRAMSKPRTRAEAETYNRDNMPEKVVVVTDPEGKDLMENRENMTTVVFNVSTADKMAEDIAHSEYLKEIWLSPEVNPYDFMYNLIKKGQRNVIAESNSWESSAAIPLYLSEGTVFIPESRVNEFKQTIDDKSFYGYIGGALTIKCYSGDDVVAAQKSGASAAKEICTTHKYNTQIRSADRVCHYADHDDYNLYYYSCGYCGKCEYNPNHVDYSPYLEVMHINLDSYKAIQRHGTVYGEFPADEVYIGVNAAGEHVWWHTCPLCGVFNPYEFNTYDQLNSTGADPPFEEWKAQTIAGNKKLEEEALNSTERYYPGTFSLPLKSDAKISSWAQSDVNLALNDNLIDTALLGSDYTQNISRLQFCSVAVKLAEELTGKSITPANANTFTDTNDTYALKAYASGITSGVTANTFDPNGTLTRQQMGTFLYRALRYAEQNSDYSYTDYTSKLANYKDSWAVQSWATEAMAFMNALDLIKGTTDTTLEPDGICTIEQAVAVAERSVYAHLIGWYQVSRAKNMSPTSDLGKANMGGFALREGDYVWVTGRRYGVKVSTIDERNNADSLYVPIINSFNGQPSEMKNGDLVPVRN